MTGLNANDAMGLLEDLSIINSAKDASVAHQQTKESLRQSEILRSAASKLATLSQHVRDLTAQVESLNRELNQLRERKNEHVAVIQSTEEAFKYALKDFSEIANVPVERLEAQYFKKLRTRLYDGKIVEMLGAGFFSHDPRQDDKIRKRAWYERSPTSSFEP
jgi:hypothetical protein